MSDKHEHDDHDHHHRRDRDRGCGCGCRGLRKLARHTHVAGANCCSSFKNIFSRRRFCCR